MVRPNQSAHAVSHTDALQQKSHTVGFLHTTASTIAMVDTYMKMYVPNAQSLHIYDGRIRLDNFRSALGTTPRKNLLRWANYACQLEREDCQLLVSCCSLMPLATAYAKAVVSVPFIQLDQTILDEAVNKYHRIGIVTTTDRTIPFIKEELEKRAVAGRKEIELVFGGDSRAIEYFYAGEFENHDKIVLDSVLNLASRGVDCVLMGQIPLALLEKQIDEMAVQVPVVCAGRKAFENIQCVLQSTGTT